MSICKTNCLDLTREEAEKWVKGDPDGMVAAKRGAAIYNSQAEPDTFIKGDLFEWYRNMYASYLKSDLFERPTDVKNGRWYYTKKEYEANMERLYGGRPKEREKHKALFGTYESDLDKRVKKGCFTPKEIQWMLNN